MTSVQVVPGDQQSMRRDVEKGANGVAKLFNMQPLNYNTPTIVPQQVPGCQMMEPYRAPLASEEVIGYELYYPRDLGGPIAFNIAGMRWVDACFDSCCNPCAFGPLGFLFCVLGVNPCVTCAMKKYQKMYQRPVYGKKGTDITKLVPPSSLLNFD